jgi:hypothetical protein
MEDLMSQMNANPEIVLIVGGIISLVGAYKIITKGFALAIWMVLLVVGVSLTDYGLTETGTSISPELKAKISKLSGSGQTISEETLKQLCKNK